MFTSEAEANIQKDQKEFKGKVGRQVWVSLVANLMQSMEGVVVAMSSIMIPQLMNSSENEEEITLTSSQATWFGSIFTIGFLSGSFLGAIQGDYFGQRISLVIDSVLSAIGIFIIVFAPSYHYLLIGRFLGGHASASGTVTIPIYTSEICHPKVRNITGSFLLTFYFLGYSLTTFLGTIFPWRTTLLILCVIPFLTTFFLLMSPDSPVWLLRQGKEENSIKSFLYFLGDKSKALEEVKIIKENILTQQNNNLNQAELNKKMRFKRLSSPEFYKPLVICIILTAVFVAWNGIGVISVYMVTFVDRVKIPLNPFVAATLNSVIVTVCSTISAGWISRFRRRVVYFTCASLMTLGTTTILSYHFLLDNNYFRDWGVEDHYILKWVPLVGYLTFSISYSSGFIQISYMAQGELFPSDLRSFGSGIVGFVDGISLFGATKMALYMLDGLGVVNYFAYSTVMVLTSIIAAYLFLPETHGKSLTEIENEFRK